MFILIDHYDSFTYNLAALIRACSEEEVLVLRPYEVSDEKLQNCSAIFLSPGPGLPSKEDVTAKVLEKYASKKPIYGVCLGLQYLFMHFGGKLKNLDHVFHGLSTPVKKQEDSRFYKELPGTFEVGRYHSWVGEKTSLPDELKVTLVDENNEIMAIEHRELPITAVQFHPESIMTPNGKDLIKLFLSKTIQVKAATNS